MRARTFFYSRSPADLPKGQRANHRVWLAAVPADEYTATFGPVLFTSHDIRHLYVSWLLRQMKQRYANDAEKLSALRQALQQRLAWRSPLTIHCYDQSESDRERLEQFDAFLQEMKQSTGEQVRSPLEVPVLSTKTDTVPPVTRPAPPVAHAVPYEIVPVVQRNLSDLAFWEDEI